MTNTQTLTRFELSHAYTPNTPDDAPCVDGNGDPRFVAENEIENADYMSVVELDLEIADWNEAAYGFSQEEINRWN